MFLVDSLTRWFLPIQRGDILGMAGESSLYCARGNVEDKSYPLLTNL